jgi:hypothetical protein
MTPVVKRPSAPRKNRLSNGARISGALSPLVLTRSFAFQPSRSYSAMQVSANCFQRSYWPDARAPKSA